MGFWIYRKIRKLLQTKPVQLWGISLLAGLLVWLAAIGFWAIPAMAWFLDLVFSGSMALIFLRAYQGAAPAVGDLFSPFRREQLPHVVGGMAWMSLWVFLWSLIPVAGLILGPVKLYTYRFAPYILMTRPDVKATDAIRISAQETRGYRGKMFLADLLIYGSWSLLLLVLLGLAQIPFLRVPCYALLILATLLGAALTPLLAGLAQAGFYDEVQHCLADPAYSARYAPPAPPAYIPPAAGQQPQGSAGVNVQYCPICGQAAPKSARFCNNCGTKLDGSTL